MGVYGFLPTRKEALSVLFGGFHGTSAHFWVDFVRIKSRWWQSLVLDLVLSVYSCLACNLWVLAVGKGRDLLQAFYFWSLEMDHFTTLFREYLTWLGMTW